MNSSRLLQAACALLAPVMISTLLHCTSGQTPDCSGDAGCGPGVDGPLPEGTLEESGQETGTDADMSHDVVNETGDAASPG